MPEGDTVWRTARRLDEALSGRVLTRTDVRVPAYATVDLTGETVLSTVSRGKHLLTRIGARHTLQTHLKMEGSWHLYPPRGRWQRPAHQARIILGVAERVAVGFSLGVVEIVPRDLEHQLVGHLGPDLLGPDWDPEEAVRRLSRSPDRAVAVALLDQRNLAGVGNMYAAEVCFLAGLHPTRAVGEVPDLGRLVHRAHAVLEANKDRVEQSTTGDLRRDRRLWVYGRAGRPCLRCGTPITVADLNGRVSFWCPRCQPPPTAPGAVEAIGEVDDLGEP